MFILTKMKLKKNFNNQVVKYYDQKKLVLECGCGLGKTSIYYANNNMKAYAMDLEQDMVDKTQELSNKYNIKTK